MRTIDDVLDLIHNEKHKCRCLTYFIYQDEKTKLLNITLTSINKEYKMKGVVINSLLYSKLVEILKNIKQYENYMIPRL